MEKDDYDDDEGDELRLGIGAVVSFQAKFLHPQKLRDSKFGKDIPKGKKLENAVVVRKALKKLKGGEASPCVVVHHSSFKDKKTGKPHELWCSELHVSVDKEGDPNLFFEVDTALKKKKSEYEKAKSVYLEEISEAKSKASSKKLIKKEKSETKLQKEKSETKLKKEKSEKKQPKKSKSSKKMMKEEEEQAAPDPPEKNGGKASEDEESIELVFLKSSEEEPARGVDASGVITLAEVEKKKKKGKIDASGVVLTNSKSQRAADSDDYNKPFGVNDNENDDDDDENEKKKKKNLWETMFGGGGKGKKEGEEEEKKAGPPQATIGEVFTFAKTPRVKWNLAIGLFASALSGAIQPAIAIVFASSFTNFADTNSKGIQDLAFIFMGLGVYAFLTMTIQSTFLETAAAEMTDAMKKDWFEALLRQDIAYYDIMDTSGTATIITANGKKFKKGLGRKLGDGIQFTITALGGLGFGFWCSWQLSLIILAIVPIMAVVTGLVMTLNQTKTARANESYEKSGSIVFSTVSSIRTILSLNAVNEVISNFEKATQEAYVGATSQLVYIGAANGSLMAVFLLAYIPVTLYGSYLIYTNLSETGCDPSGGIPDNVPCKPSGFEVFGSLMGITFGGAVLPQISASLEAFVGSRSACYPALVAIYRKIARDGEEPAVVEADKAKSRSLQERNTAVSLPEYAIDSSSPDGIKPDSVIGDIEFQNVSFKYPTRLETDVYNDLNLTIKAGTTVALCGPSGGGKSTIIQLLERFYDPSSGLITLDGQNLKDLNVNWLRQQIGLVSQEPKLFAGSIMDNIKMGQPNATFEEVVEAAKKANAHDFINDFGSGYETMVGDEGSQLSGGQKQRIAIARTLIMDPKIILLDEATSALDSESEVIVQKALDKLIEEDGGNKTIIVIAHRLSTIKNADMIAVLSEGMVVETGKHSELISNGGVYYDLVEAQKGSTVGRRDSLAESTQFLTNNDELPRTFKDHDLIHFHKVEFKYPSRPEQKIFRGLEMGIKEGETVAIVGPSGQGKSTIIQLIEQFYHPDKGCLTYKGVQMTDLNVAWLRSQMSLVAQEPTLFDISVKENIRFGMPDATQDDIENAAKEANCHDFIIKFPDGYETIVGSAASTQVSGGQKQRIAIARALLRKPNILLLDEATSALDSESEQIVQAALDNITSNQSRTVVQIAHRLSTVRNSDRIVVLNNGKLRESGTHNELMALKGHYHRLVGLQDLDDDTDRKAFKDSMKESISASFISSIRDSSKKSSGGSGRPKADILVEKSNAKKARSLSRGDEVYFVIGSIGALLAGLIFPGWGFTFAFMVDLLYLHPVFPCNIAEDKLPPPPFNPLNTTCEQYWDLTVDEMRQLSFNISYVYLGLMALALIGNTVVFYGFGTATERMNKRVRDASFKNLVRQEVSYFDMRPVSAITSQLSDDAAMIHSFSGEPIRTLVMNLASVLVGLIVSFVYMWPFALVALAVLPFMAFGAEAEQRMYMGEDETSGDDEKTSGIIVIESLTNIRTVASLSLEVGRSEQFVEALHKEDPTPLKTNFFKGVTSGIGPFFQQWSFALLYWWGGYLIARYPNTYSSQGWLISMFSLLFSLSGMAAAAQGTTDRAKAQAAADRIFDLMERKSEIDPLSSEGKKDV